MIIVVQVDNYRRAKPHLLEDRLRSVLGEYGFDDGRDQLMVTFGPGGYAVAVTGVPDGMGTAKLENAVIAETMSYIEGVSQNKSRK